MQDEILGQRIKAVVSLKRDVKLSGEDIKVRCKKKLPPYMVPYEIDIMPELPRTLTSKIDRVKIKRNFS